MGSDGQERAVAPEMNMQTEGKNIPMHSTRTLFMERKMKNMKGICFEHIWFFVFDFTAPWLSEFATFPFDRQ